MVDHTERRRQTDAFYKQIKIIVYSGLILAVITGIATQFTIAWKVQNNLVASNILLKQNFANLSRQRVDDALRAQSNAHDMAIVIDSIRDAVWDHTSSGKPKFYTPLSERILDVPIDKKVQINKHIGDVPLVTKD